MQLRPQISVRIAVAANDGLLTQPLGFRIEIVRQQFVHSGLQVRWQLWGTKESLPLFVCPS